MDININNLCDVFNYVVITNKEKENDKIDENLIQYNNLYQSHDFYKNKFPDGYENINGFDLIIDSIVEKSKTNSPLSEYNNRVGNSDK